MMDTTRRYPRTMRDAFKGLDYACAIERSSSAPSHEWALYIVAVVAVIVIWRFS